MKPSIPRGVDEVVDPAVPADPVDHQKASEALMDQDLVASDHLPMALSEGPDKRPETVPAWIAPGEVKARADLAKADLIKVDLIKAKQTMVLPSVAEEVVEVVEAAAEVAAEVAVIQRLKHRLHWRTKKTPGP
jgi:hypothetical protein